MTIIDIPPLPQHEDLARKARVLFKATPEGEPMFPHVRTSYAFFGPGEYVARFVEVPMQDIVAVLAAGREAKEPLVALDPAFDPTGQICTIGVVVW